MAKKKEGIPQPAQPKPRLIQNPLFLALFIVGVFAAAMLYQAGYINLPDFLRSNFYGLGDENALPVGILFVGEWASVSPATYYALDIDGEKFTEYNVKFHLNIKMEGKGYLGSGWMDIISYKTVPTYSMGADFPSPPPVPNPGGRGYSSPISFDARGYLPPQQGISSFELSGNKMTVTTPLSGGTERIVLNLVKADAKSGNKDALYVTLSVIPTSRGQSMGEESGQDAIVLVRK